MKKATGTIITGILCIVLSLIAFFLPGYANGTLMAGGVNLMERETPAEYMQDNSLFTDTVFVSENQIESLKADAEEFIYQLLGVKIPPESAFEHSTFDRTIIDNTGLRLNMSWVGDVAVRASFYLTGAQGNELICELENIIIADGYDPKKLAGLKVLAVDILNDELGIKEISDDLRFSSSVRLSFANGQTSDVQADISWINDSSSNSPWSAYTVLFDDVDLWENTAGKIRGVINSNLEGFDDWIARYDTHENRMSPLFDNNLFIFSDEEAEKLIESAISFLAGRGVSVDKSGVNNVLGENARPDIRHAHQVNTELGRALDIWFYINPPGNIKNPSIHARVVILEDNNILGWVY